MPKDQGKALAYALRARLAQPGTPPAGPAGAAAAPSAAVAHLINLQARMDSILTFIKKCWPIICTDFYNLHSDFHSNPESICLQSINESYITLIPKKDDASKVNDYRPISLLNSSIKILTKILANRLQSVLPSLLHKNQYGFIKK
jgi:hypothetical protein